MSNPYREIFKAPGAMGFSAAGFVARMPLAMITVGIVAMISQTHGTYALAGAVSATFALANALIAPQISRMVDRRGQGRILGPATAIAVSALVALMLATRYQAPTWTLFLFAILAGLMPSMTALVRARWTELYRETPRLHTAFAFESILDEAIYMVGPVIAIGLSVAVFPEAGPMAATVLLALGTALFVAQKSTEPPVHAWEKNNDAPVIRLGSLQILTLALAAIGAIVGTAEVAVIAFAEEHGRKAAASLVLAAYAAGSLLAGIVFGAKRLAMPPARQLQFAIGLAALTTLPLLIVDSIPALAVALFFAGAAISPTIILAMGMIERLVPPAKLTEAITWESTGIGLGVALGSSIAGLLIDESGARSGFYVSITAGGVALITVLLGYRTLTRQVRRGEAARYPTPAIAERAR